MAGVTDDFAEEDALEDEEVDFPGIVIVIKYCKLWASSEMSLDGTGILTRSMSYNRSYSRTLNALSCARESVSSRSTAVPESRS